MKEFSSGKSENYRYLAVLTVLSLLLLPACGGGGNADGNVIDPGVADIREEFLSAVNQARSIVQICGTAPFGPVPPVARSDHLAMAAYLHAEDMALNGFFSHAGSDGSSAGRRISRQGYPWRTYGENIAVGPFGGNPSARYWTFDLADR